MLAVVMLSGGAGSWGAAKRTVQRYGATNVRLLFADTRMEDKDLYRFLIEGVANVEGVSAPIDLLAATVNIPEVDERDARQLYLAELQDQANRYFSRLRWIADGRDPWQVFRDKRYLGNTRIDPCSAELKRKLMRRWLEANCDPAETVAVIGYDWTEEHRVEKAAGYWEPWAVESPLCDEPFLTKDEVLAWMEDEGLDRPDLYELGFEHNNCGGFCVKAGQAQYERLLRKRPRVYAFHEKEEQALRAELGKDIAILRDRRGGKTKPMTMKAFRERLEADPTKFDKDEWGGCGCAVPMSDEAE